MKSIVLIACILAYAVAQQPTLVHLTNGTTVSGSLGVSADAETAEKTVDYYTYQIPANVDVITVSFNPDPTDNSPCTYLYYFFSVATIPCSSLWSEGTGNFLPCQEAEYSYASSATEIVIRAGEFYDVTAFEPGTTLYFTVGKQGYNSDDVCPYTISIGNSNCTASQVGLYDDSDESICVPVTDLTFPAAWEVSLPSNDRVVYRFPVSQLTGNVHIAINSTYYVYAYGGYNYPYNNNYYSAPCYDSSNYEGNGEYSLDLYCGQPKKGWFYLTLIQSGSGSANATVSVSSLPCAANAGGVWCQHFAQNYTDSAPVNRTIRAYNSSIDSSSFYPGDFYYVNYPAGTLANVNFTVCNGANSLTVTYRKDGFPFSGSYSTSVGAFECLTVVIRPEDTYIGGSYVVGVINPSSTTVASYQISKAAASFDSTTGQTTEGDGSGAAALVAPVVMVIAMLALLF